MDGAVSVSSRRRTDVRPFRFFDLPAELRLKILDRVLVLPQTVDLEPDNYRYVAPRLRLFLVSHRMHVEAAECFFGSNTFRVFPIHGRFFHTKKPLLVRLSPRYRALIKTIELRLGPGWTKPPKCWVVDARLGLEQMTKGRLLKIFAECDPASDEIFEGFRAGQDFYTFFCKDLVQNVLEQIPSVVEVQFDAYPSVTKGSPLMQALINEGKARNKRISYGPARGWNTDLSKAMAALRFAIP
ncbi:uncharacterized protein BDZ99DRAFT_457691 [Mytilinidion resinicola]|uniref:F-box domain-containing protein n=1 Tax=Mytilinidion resinicola TaxID=574789 RepID=A0A6A6Z3J2_9PEZI|nr:uncharacterized protein BDZ99DRAFT_457691 [Mytilinidion resinicola]KAF2815721.1 hypothetical protein BDZ99DRAFT_457691 [Mytilinidion resinicola]